MTYCSVQRVRLVTGLESDEIGDGKLRDLRDDVAIPEVNSDINQTIKNEEASFISDYKDNVVDGDNKTFYLQKTHNSFRQLGDFNDDGVVDSSDVEAVMVDGDTKESLNVVSIDDADEGEITVERQNGDAVPSTAKVFFTYAVAPVDAESPDVRIATACAELTGAYAFTNIDVKKLKNYSIGDVSINRQSEGYSEMRERYMQTISALTQRETITSGTNNQKISDVF